MPDADTLNPQISVNTLCGRFILDFVINGSNGSRTAIECDGKDFHNFSRDEWRDAMILGEQHVDVIYRLRGADLVHNITDVLYIMSIEDPYLFSERGLKNLFTLAPGNLKNTKIKQDDSLTDFHPPGAQEPTKPQIYVRRAHVSDKKRHFGQAAYNMHDQSAVAR